MAHALIEAREGGHSTVALYGAGKHTAGILSALFEAPVEIAAFLDDDPRRQGQKVLGWDIIAPDQAKARGVRAVILNSDHCEGRMWARRAFFEDQGMVVLRLYPDAVGASPRPETLPEIEAAMGGGDPLHRSAVQKYWASRGSAQADTENNPLEYTANYQWSVMLADWLEEAGVSCEDPILELGCNIGRNLASLRRRGFRALSGIEINPRAVETMRELYPHTGSTASVTVGPLEEELPACGDDAYQVVFTMAVLEHIHPDSEFILDHMVRIARRYVLTIEDETHAGPRHFRRDYGEVFTRRHCRQVRVLDFDSVDPEEFTLLGLSPGHVARLFEVPQGRKAT